jgi:peptide chain release factor subunit 1
MQPKELDAATLRRLSGMRPEQGKVLSIYLDLDPSELATPAARSSAITSVLDRAGKLARRDGLERDEKMALREDLERAREFFSSDFTPRSAGSVALFACSPAGLFEAVRLPRRAGTEAVVDDTPWVEPLAGMGRDERLCVALVDRRNARILQGTRERLEEVATIEDDVHGWHDQGGLSQLRYQRGIEKEVQDHLAHTANRLFAGWKRRPFDHLLVGATEELWPAFEERLHPYVRERVVGRFDADVEKVSPHDVVGLIAPVLEEDDRRRERAALERLEAALGAGGRAEAGLDAVLGALNERRVETLLLGEGVHAAGVACPRCGWLGVDAEECPLDGGPLERRTDVIEDAIEAAVLQAADILVVRHHDELERHDGVAALLRF